VKLPLTPLDFLARARRLFPDRVGVVQGDDLRMTYATFARRCDALAALLRDDVGIAPGDRVAFLAGNVHQLLEAYYGVLLAGGVLLPLNIRNSAPELAFCLEDASAVALFRDSSLPDPGFAGPTTRTRPRSCSTRRVRRAGRRGRCCRTGRCTCMRCTTR